MAVCDWKVVIKDYRKAHALEARLKDLRKQAQELSKSDSDEANKLFGKIEEIRKSGVDEIFDDMEKAIAAVAERDNYQAVAGELLYPKPASLVPDITQAVLAHLHELMGETTTQPTTDTSD